MEVTRYVSLQTSEHEQTLKIPQEFTLPGTKVLLCKEGQRLIIEPVSPDPLLALLATLPDIDDEFPDTDEGLLPFEYITL